MRFGAGRDCGMPPPVSKVLMSVAFWAVKSAKPINETRLTQEVRRNVEQEDGDMFGLGGGTPDETLGWFFLWRNTPHGYA